jgi:hypothetical protein
METSKISKVLTVLFAVVLCFGPVGLAEQAGTAFTYQGRMMDSNQTADGLYDFQFKLYDRDSNGNQVGSNVNVADLDVIDGYFTAELDFNDVNAFRGDARWLQIGVRAGALSDPNGYTLLSPRQEVTPTPHAIYAQSSGGLTTSEDLVLISGSGNVQVGSSDEPATLHIFGERRMYDANGAEGFSTLGVYPTLFDGASYSETTGAKFYTTSGPITITPAEANVSIGTAGSPANLNNFGIFKVYSTSGYGGMSPLGVFPTEFSGASYSGPTAGGKFFTTSGPLTLDAGDGNVAVGTADNHANLNTFGTFRLFSTSGYGGMSPLGVFPTSYEGASYSESEGGKLYTTSGPLTFDAGDGNVAVGNVDKPSNFNNFGTFRLFSTSGYGGMSPLGVFPTQFDGSSYGEPSEEEWDFGADATAKMSVRFTSDGSGSNMAIVSNGGKLIVGALNKATDLSVHGEIRSSGPIRCGHSITLWPEEYILSTTGNIILGKEVDEAFNPDIKVGIGTMYPDCKLDVEGEVRVGGEASRNILLDNTDIYAYNNGVPDTLWLQSILNPAYPYPNTVMNKYGGNVGIGIESPTEKIDVNGTARLRGIAELSDPNARAVLVDAAGKLWKVVSSQRYKTDIRNLDADTDAVLKLRPVRFQYKSSGQQDIGLIAEEVEKVSRDLVIYDGEGRPDAVKYDKVALYLLSVVKDQQKENEDIKNRLATMESLVAKLSQQQEGGIK